MGLVQTIWRNTISNYLRVVVESIIALLLTRTLVLNLPEAHYGFWALIWSLWGLSALTELGLGLAVQRAVAEYLVDHQTRRLNAVVSTTFVAYLGIALILSILVLLVGFHLDSLFQISEDVVYYQQVFVAFGILSALAFPFGASAELLAGLKRLDIRNRIRVLVAVANLVGLLLMIQWGLDLLAIALWMGACTLMSQVVQVLCATYLLPVLRFRPSLISWSEMRRILSFSVFGYMGIASNTILWRTDNLVLGAFLGLPAVAIYQIGSRLAQLFRQLTVQFQESLSPIASSLNHAGEEERLYHLMLISNRWAALTGTFCFLLLVFLTPQILYCWLEVKKTIYHQVAYLMLTVRFVHLLFRSAAGRILLLAGRHRLMGLTALGEALLNLVLSLIWVRYWGIWGVCLGSLVPATFSGLGILLPATCRFCKHSIFAYCRIVFIPALMSAGPTLLFLLACTWGFPQLDWGLWALCGVSLVAAVLYFVTAYVLVLSPDEKAWVRHLLGRRAALQPKSPLSQ